MLHKWEWQRSWGSSSCSRAFLAKALDYWRMWPNVSTRTCDALNVMARVDEKPDMTCSYEKFNGRRYRGPVLPYMMPGRGIV